MHKILQPEKQNKTAKKILNKAFKSPDCVSNTNGNI